MAATRGSRRFTRERTIGSTAAARAKESKSSVAMCSCHRTTTPKDVVRTTAAPRAARFIADTPRGSRPRLGRAAEQAVEAAQRPVLDDQPLARDLVLAQVLAVLAGAHLDDGEG